MINTPTIIRIAAIGATAALAVTGCGEDEPSDNLTSEDAAAFCPPAMEWFDVYDTRRDGAWGSTDADWLATHEAEREALAALEPIIESDWRDQFDNDIRREYEQVAADNADRLAAIEDGGGTVRGSRDAIIQINLRRNVVTFNNFVISGVCSDET